MINRNDDLNHVTQLINTANNVTTGDVHNYPAHQLSEPELQVNFFKLTNLWCPPEARKQFELLLSQYGFTVQELTRAIKAGYLEWNHDLQQFKTKNVRFLLGFFYFIVLFFALDFSVTFLDFINKNPINQWPNNIIVVVNMVIYLALMYFYGRYTIWPSKPLARIKLALAKMYAPKVDIIDAQSSKTA